MQIQGSFPQYPQRTLKGFFKCILFHFFILDDEAPGFLSEDKALFVFVVLTHVASLSVIEKESFSCIRNMVCDHWEGLRHEALLAGGSKLLMKQLSEDQASAFS